MRDEALLTIDDVLPDIRAGNQKQALQVLADQAGKRTGLNPAIIFAGLMSQENDSTRSGIGDGVAILHYMGKKIDTPYTVLARASHPVDYNSVDGAPVDLICLMISPDNEDNLHLQRMARASRLLRDQSFCNLLRGTTTEDAMKALLMQTEKTALAA